MATTSQSAVMKGYYNELRRIQQAIHPRYHPDTDLVDPAVLSSLPICISELPLDPDDLIDLEPRFSRVVPQAQLERRFAHHWGSSGEKFPDRWLEHQEWEHLRSKVVSFERSLLEIVLDCTPRWITLGYPEQGYRRQIDDSLLSESGWEPRGFDFERREKRFLRHGEQFLNRCNRPDDDNVWWNGYSSIFTGRLDSRMSRLDDRQRPKPHLTFTLMHAVPFTNLVPLRSEIMCIVTLMKRQMRAKDLADHRLFPVFAYTMNGTSVRITQAVFDKQRLHLRQSKAFDIQCLNRDFTNLKLLLRWMLAEPCGETLWDKLEADPATPPEQHPPSESLAPGVTVGA